MQPIPSPWSITFERFVRSINCRAIIVAPFITEQPLQQFISALNEDRPPKVSLLTNLSADGLFQGSIDGKAIADFCRYLPTAMVRHLPGLHAKAYVADEHTAIVTSGNLTSGSLHRNYEYGIQINDPAMVSRIASDLIEYGNLGTTVSIEELDRLSEIAAALKGKHARQLDAVQTSVRQELREQLSDFNDSLLELRGKPGESTNAIFARTIIYLLRRGPHTTQHMHPLIQNIHPDLCDDNTERVINGIRFGKEWKHRVRGAQVDLRRKGTIELIEGSWQLVTS